jgi:hypothetical protein
MPIKSGRNGQVAWDPAGGTAVVPIISLNAWTGDFKTEYEDVTCFGDTNKVYIPGMMDMGGTIAGFFNSAELAVFRAAMSTTPGTLKLTPTVDDPTIFFQGKAYMSASIDCSLEAPKVTGEWKAAGPWTVPGQVLATGAGPGTGTGTFTPTNASAPANFADLSDATPVTANPATAWTTGQFIQLADGTRAHWNGTAWVVGAKP